MREILFRGQTRKLGERVNMNGDKLPGKWVYGGIFPQNKGGAYSIIYTYKPIDKYPVYSETVGQYTGLTDKNGIKIFEGDILKDSLGCIYVVEWEEEGRFLGFTKDRRIMYVNRVPKSEIIGNIFDNPELMEESQ